jgi:effector-binding domain-containing protein
MHADGQGAAWWRARETTVATDIHITEQAEVHTAGVRRTVPMNELRGFFSAAFATTMQAVAAQGGHPIGPPFAKYYGMPGDVIDVEAGFPIDRVIAPSGEVAGGMLPAGRTVEATHVGPYETLADSYAEVEEFIGAHHLVPGAYMWESYLSDPQAEPDPSHWRTLIQWPVTDRKDAPTTRRDEDPAVGAGMLD